MSIGGVKFTAVKAEHSDPTPIGVIIDDGENKYYVTGDTLYNEEIFEDIPKDIYALIFVEKIKPQKTVPIHIGMFDGISAEEFDCKNKVIMQIYKEMEL